MSSAVVSRRRYPVRRPRSRHPAQWRFPLLRFARLLRSDGIPSNARLPEQAMSVAPAFP